MTIGNLGIYDFPMAFRARVNLSPAHFLLVCLKVIYAGQLLSFVQVHAAQVQILSLDISLMTA